MNRRLLLLAFALFLLIALGGLVAWPVWRSPRSRTTTAKDNASAAAVVSKPPGTVSGSAAGSPATAPVPTATPLSPEDRATAAATLRQIFARFGSMGGGEKGPPFDYVAREVADRDKVKVNRAFNELVYRYTPGDSLPVLRSYVNDADPYTRYMAARSLLIAGDDGGVAALTTLLKSEQPIEGFDNKEDLRVSAAEVLARYHQTAAISDVAALYSKTHNSYLVRPLSNLGIPLPGQEHFSFVAGDGALIEYAQTNDTRFIPQIRVLFEHTNKRPLKAAAAWSLATMTGDAAATNFLIEKARSGLDPAHVEDARDERETIKYVGTLQSPEAKQTLEAALDDTDAVVVQTAIVNLLYNQGGSKLAIQKVADQLSDNAHPTLPWEFTFNVAAKFADDPVIQAAGRRFAQHDDLQQWRRYVAERRTWPSENWVGDYMIQIRR